MATRPVAGLTVACSLSALAVCLLVGGNVLVHPGRGAVGVNPSSDYQVMTWSLRWWPWAIAHGVDPLQTPLLWAPSGFSTLWMTTIPVPALVALPITLTAGPLVAFNVLMLLAVPLAAGGAYLLCRELTGRFWPSLVGSVLFGLSPYMLGHTLSQHLDLTFVFPVPLLGLLVVKHLRGRVSATRFVVGFAVLLLVLLGASFELFLDLAVLVAIGAVFGLARAESRQLAFRTIRLIAIAYGVCLPLLVPIAVLAFSAAHAPLRYAPVNFSTDVLNLVVPTPTVLAGRSHWLRRVTQHFVSNIGEQDGYLGVPLLLVAALAVRAEWRRGAWFIGGLLVVALLLSFGPVLSVGGHPVVDLPFAIARLPLLGGALPARLSLFVALAAACLCALWLALPGRGSLRTVVAVIVVVSVLPNFVPVGRLSGAWAVSSAFGWSIPRVSDGFVAARGWMRVIRPGSTVLVLPTGDRTAASYWQAETGMRFKLAVPATPFAPPQLAASPIVSGLVDDNLGARIDPALAAARLRAFLIADQINDVVITPAVGPRLRAVVRAATGSRPLTLGPTNVYPVPAPLEPLRLASASHVAIAPHQNDLVAARTTRALATWVYFDGSRAHLHARFDGQTAVLSSPFGDASQVSTAVDESGHAAVAFVEWRDHHALLRLATRSKHGWRVRTFVRSSQPIWSTRVALLADGGTAVAVWVEEHDPFRVLRAVTLPTTGRPQIVTLETGANLDSVNLAAAGFQAECAWLDAVASERRVRATTFYRGRWHGDHTIFTTLDSIWQAALNRQGSVAEWTTGLDPTHPTTFLAHRAGTAWIDTERIRPTRPRPGRPRSHS